MTYTYGKHWFVRLAFHEGKDKWLTRDITPLDESTADALVARINNYESVVAERDEAVEILKRVKRDSIGLPDFCSVCMDDTEAFLAKIEAQVASDWAEELCDAIVACMNDYETLELKKKHIVDLIRSQCPGSDKDRFH